MAQVCAPPPAHSDNSHGDKMAARRPAALPQARRALAAAPGPQERLGALRVRSPAGLAVKNTIIRKLTSSSKPAPGS